MLSDADRALALEFRRRLEAAGVPVVRMVVYGSRARGEARPDSDLDVLVVLEAPDEHAKYTVWDVAWGMSYEQLGFISPAVMTRARAESDLEQASLYLQNLRAEGITL